jgi:ABC-type multidrug transport system ATPase subunit
MALALAIHDLHRSYRAGIAGCSATVQALRGVDLELAEGEIAGIVGERGSGKTTLLQCAAGQLKPDRGAISWFGTPAPEPRPHGVVFVPEKSVYYSSLTVREALEYYATVTDVASSRRATQVSEALRRCALASDTERRVRSLTDSQLRRLGIAQALLASPRLLLIDGGVAQSDRTHTSDAWRLLLELASQGVAILLATRELAALRPFASRVLSLTQGRLREVSAAGGVAGERALEVAVSSPIPDCERLSAQITGIVRRGERLRIPLNRHSPEEILSQCRTLGIAVNHSRVIQGSTWI